MRKILTAFFLCTTFIGISQNKMDSLTLQLESLSKNNSIKGFGVAIFNKNKVLYSKGFGYSDTESKTPYTLKTVQKIASISKLFLGVSLMKAQEMNLLSLDDSVNKYLPFKLKNERLSSGNITIRNLATHTSGLKKLQKYDLKALYFPTKVSKIKKELPFGFRKLLMNKFVKMVNRNEDLLLKEFLYNIYNPKGKNYSKKHFKKVKAGEKEIYSNQGASMLALIIEKVSGMKYNDFVREHILSKLKMNNSGFDFEMQNNLKLNKSSLYHSNIKVPNDFKLILYPAGGFETCIDDFSKFMVNMANGSVNGNKLLSKSSFDEMLQLPKNKNLHHGILWESYPSSTIGHEGNIAGVTTYAYYNRKQDKGYILFCNTAGTKKIDKDTLDIINTLKKFYRIFNGE